MASGAVIRERRRRLLELLESRTQADPPLRILDLARLLGVSREIARRDRSIVLAKRRRPTLNTTKDRQVMNPPASAALGAEARNQPKHGVNGGGLGAGAASARPVGAVS